jgi:CRISPR-associated protein Cas2
MKNMTVICFDVSDPRRLYRVARELGNFGVRVQKSVFECYLRDDELARLQKRLAKHIDANEDQVRYYFLCGKDVEAVTVDGPGSVTRDPGFTML